jgi:hypothetical protein
MTTERFRDVNPRGSTLATIDQANVIIEEYQAQGFALTTRQLYYQFVARGLIENTPRAYVRLAWIVCVGRDAGLIDWAAIEDRTREVNTHASWRDPAAIVGAAARSYREDLWADQRYRPAVWIEKDALIGVIEGVCTELRVPYFATRGNVSQTLAHEAGRRFKEYFDLGRTPIVLHLADHDPAGIDMTRDLRERLALYADDYVEVRRVALTEDQVQEHDPPPNPAKEKDSRFAKYEEQFGTDSWELDALSPATIADLIRPEIESMIDRKLWRRAAAAEIRGRRRLEAAAADWPAVEAMIDGRPRPGSRPRRPRR